MKISNVQYRLAKPYKLVKSKSYLNLSKDKFLIKPYMVSVCKSDLRYYTGNRPKDVLKRKLPMVLLHEGIGVIQETKAEFKKGDLVIIIPQLSNSVKTSEYNYISSNKFLSSSCDGLLQQYVCLPRENILKKPEYVSKSTVVLVELISVAHHAQARVKIDENDRIAVLGDGVFGHIVYYTLQAMYKNKISIYGKNDRIKKSYDTVFECVGTYNAKSAIDTALRILNPCGQLVLLGVSEMEIPMKTRVIIEKGLKLIGSNRSTRKDFLAALELLRKKRFRENINSLIEKRQVVIRSVDDIKRHLDYLSKNNPKRKFILELSI